MEKADQPRKEQTRQRNKKGSVVVFSRNGMLRLRSTYNSQPHDLAVGLPDSPLNRRSAQDEITSDISNQRFDTTLERYRPKSERVEPKTLSTTAIFEKFIENRRPEGTSGQAIASRYVPLLSNLRRFGRGIESDTDARHFVELLRPRQSPLVSNQNLSLLKGFADWAVSQAMMPSNPFSSIKRLKNSKVVNLSEYLITREQIRAFLAAVKADRDYSSYHDFYMAMFYLGVRPSEAAGLRWKHIDWQRRVAIICESMNRGPNGETSGYARQCKSTKNSQIR